MGTITSIVGQLIACWCCYKLGQTLAWNKISKEYIAIHKSAIIGPIRIKRDGLHKGGYRHAKNYTNRTHKKTSK